MTLLAPSRAYEGGPAEAPHLGRILVALDGSALPNKCCRTARLIAQQFGSELMLISMSAIPETVRYHSDPGVVQLTDCPVFIFPINQEL